MCVKCMSTNCVYEKDPIIKWEYWIMSMLDSSCQFAHVCKLHPRNSNMLKVISLHSELWYRNNQLCSSAQRHITKG